MNRHKILAALFVLLSQGVWSQPGPIPPGANENCSANPGTDSLPYVPDAEGFSPLFDGKSMTGWWESCQSHHSNADKVKGGIWLVDAERQAIFSAQNSNGAGSILMTNKKFGNYEIIFDFWPDFNNDGGLFNRTTPNGTCYQTTLDYEAGSSIGGSFGENGYGSFNIDPYKFGGNESSIDNATWTAFTATKNPASFGCPAGGCTAAEWTKLWDINGWNQVRVKIYGGMTSASQVHMDTWIRDLRTPNKPWVPILSEARSIVTPASYIGLQIHGGTGAWQGKAGDWYRNIKWRPLEDKGDPPTRVVASQPSPRRHFYATASALEGNADEDCEFTVSDVRGKILEHFSAHSGSFHHAFAKAAYGVLLVEMKSSQGIERLRLGSVTQ